MKKNSSTTNATELANLSKEFCHYFKKKCTIACGKNKEKGNKPGKTNKILIPQKPLCPIIESKKRC